MLQSSVLRSFPFSPPTFVFCSPLFFPSLSKYASLWISSTSQDFTYHLFFVTSQKITSPNIKPICQLLVQSLLSTDHPSPLQAIILQSICYVPSIADRTPLSQSFSISGTPFCQFQVQFSWCSSLLCVLSNPYPSHQQILWPRHSVSPESNHFSFSIQLPLSKVH